MQTTTCSVGRRRSPPVGELILREQGPHVDLDRRHLALGPIEASFSRHLLFDPSIEGDAIVEAMSTAIRIHAERRGWRYDLCLCSDENSASRRRLGYRPIGIRVDREARSTLEIYAFEIASAASVKSSSHEDEARIETEGSTS